MSAEGDLAGELRLLRQAVERQAQELTEARNALALLEDKNEFERLQYAYGY